MKKSVMILAAAALTLAGVMLFISRWKPPSPQLIATTSYDTMDEMVSATLQTHSFTATQTAAVSLRETLSVNPLAIEVTPDVQVNDPTPPTINSIPVEHYIWNITGHRQYYGIGCEASAVKDWAAFFGVEVVESHFQFQLPLSDNPDYGFVGSVMDPWGQVPPYSYGVHAYPVANLLRSSYGMNARGLKGFTLEQLKAEVAASRPVIAWVIGNMVGGIPYEYTDKEGRKVIVAAYEHVAIITGYNQDSIRYMNNGKFYDIPNQYFENSWKVLGNMVVVLDPT